MSDISACKGDGCLLRLNCHRYTCPKEELGQTYFTDPPYKLNMMIDENAPNFGVVTLACAYFWNNVKYKNDEQKPTNN